MGSATDSAGATSETAGSETTDGETSGGDPGIKCEEFATELPDLAWTATHDDTREELVALPGGHAAYFAKEHSVARVGPDGVVWSHTFDEWPFHLAPLPGDRILVAGIPTEGGQWLAILSADGELLASATPPLPDGVDIAPLVEVATSASGMIYALTFHGQPPVTWRIEIFDDALTSAGGFAIDSDRIGPSSGLAADDDGNAYVATINGIGKDTGSQTWRLDVLSYAADGALRWASDGVAFTTSTSSTYEVPEVSVGDQIYAIAGNNSAFALQALTRDGAVAWTKVHTFGKGATDPEVADHFLHAVVASPCGGAFVGGRTNLDGIGGRASAFHIGADGSFGEASVFLGTHEGLNHRETVGIALASDGRMTTVGRLEPEPVDDPVVWWVGGL